jgi:WW domain-containing oxidoreductase
MAKTIPFGAASTADQVIAGIDLSGKHFVVTGCSSGLGYETMSALAANGGRVIGLARTIASAQRACAEFGQFAIPMACDLSDLDSVAQAAAGIRELKLPLDAVIANAGVAHVSELITRHGVEQQFMVNHLGHFYLVNELLPLVRNGTGRIVMVSGSASKNLSPAEGIMFDNLDGNRFYKPGLFYGQSKLANVLYANELSRRLRDRGITANSLHPGATRGTRLHRNLTLSRKLSVTAAQLFLRSAAHGAATQTMLAASPRVAGISGEYWSNCQIAVGTALMGDADLSARLWDVSQIIIDRHVESTRPILLAAA